MKEEYVKKFIKKIEDDKKNPNIKEIQFKNELRNENRRISNVTGIDIVGNFGFNDLPVHNHSSVELIYIYQGNITININNQDILLTMGDLIIINKYIKHTLKSTDKDEIVITFLVQDKTLVKILKNIDNNGNLKEFLENNYSNNYVNDYLVYRTKDDVIVNNIINSFIYLIVEEKTDSSLSITLLHVLFELLQEMEERMLYPAKFIGKDELFRNKVLEEINKNYMKITLKDLSKLLGLTNEYLSRKINKVFGKNFSQVLLEERMNIAEEYVRNTTINITEVASLVGYENKSFFYKEFKNFYGSTPMKYRQQINTK